MNQDTAQEAKPIKLQILVSDRCNLRCGHCIVSSSPQSHRWMLSERDIEQVAGVVNTTPEVQTVHFTGGEPTLFRNLISRLQKRITRQVRYGMTTNGTIGSRLGDFLSAATLDEITLSYDRFRADQVKQDVLLDFLNIARTRAIPVTVNCVFDNLSDLAAPRFLVEAGAKLATAKLVRTGRAEGLPSGASLQKKEALSGTCPSLVDPQLKDQLKAYETVLFFPGEGFTNCCGPLVFGNSLNRHDLFATDISSLPNSPLRRFLDRTNFAEALQGYGPTKTKPCTRCEACTLLFGRKERRLAC